MSIDKDHITIYDIARKAGVSIATVSRVITGKSCVKDETRIKVENIIKKYGYEPNLIARALHDKLTNTIGLLVQSLTNPFFIEICNEAEIYARNMDYTMMIGITTNKFEMESKLLNLFEKRQVDGFIFLGGRINEVNPDEYLIEEIKKFSERLPIVFVNGKINYKNCYIVKTDEAKAFKKLIDYTISCGHKFIGLITGQRGLWPTEEKIEIFFNALKENNMEINNDWIISGEYIVESGSESMKKILKTNKRPTAVLCTNDVLAIGAMNEANKQGLNVPNDISVLGFDDIFISKYFIPGLTTIRQDYVNLARIAVDKIINHINGNFVERVTIIDADLVIRESCRKIL